METTPRPTDISLRIKCPSCGSTLSLLAGRSQLTFHCKGGHTFHMRQLFQVQAQDINRGLRAVMEVWDEKSALLHKVAEQARKDGRAALAEGFQRESEHLQVRIRTLQDHLRSATGETGTGSAAG